VPARKGSRYPPSQRHWHSNEDEIVYVLEGEVTLIEDGAETVLHAGDCATFRKTPAMAIT
jgi:uncharacterized cupin superfamily protein